jgi:hypothetical protein
MRILHRTALLALAILGSLAFNTKGHALTVTFEGHALGLVANGEIYAENGLQFQFFVNQPIEIVAGPFGHALSISSITEVLITRVGVA